jgi:acetyltransferase-like isoleucine patch superfamily enzyme
MKGPLLYPLMPGARIPHDWVDRTIPSNIAVGPHTVIDSAFGFQHFHSQAPIGLRIGSHVTICRTMFSTEPKGEIVIGDYCFLSNASFVCSARITVGSYVFIAAGVTLADSDFHPIEPAARLLDTIALSPLGRRDHRPDIEARPIRIGDDVCIGYNATILKGVQVGGGALIDPGAVVTKDVPAGSRVAGNPARVVG